MSPTQLIVGGLVLLAASWVMANPPGAAPDEDAHYVKARASAHGHLRGIRFLPPAPVDDYRATFDRDVKRAFELPSRGAADPRWGCNRVSGESAACLHLPRPAPDPIRAVQVREITHVGPYQPAPYLPMGLAVRLTSALGGSSTAALYAGRIVAAAMGLALLSAAVALAGGGWRLAATLVAVSPMVVFLASALNTSGIEICAAIALAAAIAAFRRATPSPRVTWAVVGFSGTGLALARPFGPYWMLLAAVAALFLVGPTGLRTSFAGGRPASGVAVVTVAAATVFAAVWDVVFMPAAAVPWPLALSLLGPAAATLPEVVHQTVGIFGWLDTRPPRWVSTAGEATAATVVAAAACFAPWKHRVVVAAGVLAFAAMVVGLNVFTQIPFGFLVQARYVMPLSVAVLVFAGDGLHVIGSRRMKTLATPVSLVAVTLHAAGWWTNARQSAVGATGPVLFLGRSDWSPPAGWALWGIVAALGVALMGTGVVAAARLHRP